MEEKLYTPGEISKYLRIDIRTIYSYIKNKKLKAIKVGGKYWRIRESALQKFLKED